VVVTVVPFVTRVEETLLQLVVPGSGLLSSLKSAAEAGHERTMAPLAKLVARINERRGFGTDWRSRKKRF
jgi:hypothetical protein